MHPAFSVIFFTTASGAGYGLWAWIGLWMLSGRGIGLGEVISIGIGLMLGFLLVAFGLLSSLAHLGKPARAWRAFSQWRSSWLSREGVLAVATFVPATWLLASLWLPLPGPDFGQARLAFGLLALGALATVGCTAMIYASLVPIPAWRHRAVVPAYFGFALYTGGLLLALLRSFDDDPGAATALPVLAGALALAALKAVYWRDIDRDPLPASRAAAVGLPAGREVGVFERPHTEANYLTREMGFVLARRHAARLRRLALALFAALPALLALLAWAWPAAGTALLALALASALLGTLVERWLFFAQARHLVTLYY